MTTNEAIAMEAAKAALDRFGISVRQFAETYQEFPSRVLPVPEVAKILGIHPKTVRDLINDGALRETRVAGKRIGIRLDVLAEYIESHTTPQEEN